VKPLATPQDKQKAIGLSVAVVVVFAMVIKSTLSAQGTPPPIEGASPTVAVAGSPPAAGGAQTVALANPAGTPANTAPVDDMIDPPILPPGEMPSPFHRDTVAYKGPMPTAKVEPRFVNPAPPQPRTFVKTPPDPTFGVRFGDGSPIVLHADPEPMSVMGVITGQNPVAVIRVGSQQFIVDRGSKFGHGYRLKSVSESQVVIESAGTLRMLRVGARPTAPTDASANQSSSTPASKDFGTK